MSNYEELKNDFKHYECMDFCCDCHGDRCDWDNPMDYLICSLMTYSDYDNSTAVERSNQRKQIKFKRG